MRLSRPVTALALGATLCTAGLDAQAKQRGLSGGGHVVVESDKGTFPVERVSGGNLVGDVVETNVGNKRSRHIGSAKVEPLVIEADPVALLPWIADLGKDPQKRINCTVIQSDFNGKAQSRLVVSNAWISRVEFDVFDAGSKEALSVRVTLEPELVTEDTKAGDAGKVELGRHKAIPVANFKVSIPGVDTSGVHKIGPLVYTRSVMPENLGADRLPSRHPGDAKFESLAIEVAEARAAGFVDWHRAVMIDGKRDPATTKTVTIEALGPDLKTTLLKIEVSGTLIFAARRGDMPGLDAARMRSVQLLVQGWTVGG